MFRFENVSKGAKSASAALYRPPFRSIPASSAGAVFRYSKGEKWRAPCSSEACVGKGGLFFVFFVSSHYDLRMKRNRTFIIIPITVIIVMMMMRVQQAAGTSREGVTHSSV